MAILKSRAYTGIRERLWNTDVKLFASESWSVSWPMTLIMFFEFLTGLTDIYIAGRVGKEIQASYGFIIQVYFVLIIVGNALTVGSVSVISRLFTGDTRNGLTEAIYSTLILSVVAGCALGCAGIFLTGSIVHLVNIPLELKPLATPLGRIYAAGLLFHYILIQTNGILRACKKVKSSLKTMAFVSFCNIGLAFFLVFETSLGYRGIALATAISVCAGSLVNIYKVWSLMDGTKRFSRAIAKSVVSIGWPSGLTQALWQAQTMALFLILGSLPGKGIEILAALSAGLRIESAIFLPAFAFNMANAVIVGNLLGATRKNEAFRGGVVTAFLGVPIVAFLTLVVIFNARFIAPFLSHNDIVVAETVRYLYIAMLSEPFMAWAVILGGGLMGAGDTRSVMVSIGVSLWFVRVPLCYAFVGIFGFGVTSVWWTMNLSQFVMACLITMRYFDKKWLTLEPVD
ncbi:MAG: MATE family multidrug exporter [Syntrophorhabdus sp. PtaU1.Bin153]|nr:MAG: MATE family multidrug exporter [Syntrophorhabdus sp. PtaU1.Bin153]